MANRIENYNSIPSLWLDTPDGNGDFYAHASQNTALLNDLVDGSHIIIDGSKTWRDIRIFMPILTSNGDGATGNRLPFEVTVVAENAKVVLRRFELSGGAEYVVNAKRYLDATADLPFMQPTIEVDCNYNQDTALKTRSASYTRGGTSVVATCKSIKVRGLHGKRADFANFLIKNDSVDFAPGEFMNLELEECFISDSYSGEGFYLGNTATPPGQHPIRLVMFNCIATRTAVELFQLAGAVEGTHIHNNIFTFGALDYVTPFQTFQDSGFQLNQRWGNVLIENNVILGCHGTILSVNHFPQIDNLRAATDTVTFRNNLIGFTRLGAMYFGYTGPSAPSVNDMPTIVLDENYLIGIGEDNAFPWSSDNEPQRSTIIKTEHGNLRVTCTNNKIDNRNSNVSQMLMPGTNRTETGTTFGALPLPSFIDDGIFSRGYTPFAFRKYYGDDTYQPGELVVSDNRSLYLVNQTTADNPEVNDASYTLISSEFADDYRLSGFYAAEGIGLTETVNINSVVAKGEIAVTAGTPEEIAVTNLQENQQYTLVTIDPLGVVSKSLVSTTSSGAATPVELGRFEFTGGSFAASSVASGVTFSGIINNNLVLRDTDSLQTDRGAYLSISNNHSSIAAAVAANSYASFTVSGMQSLTEISFDVRRGGSSTPRFFQLDMIANGATTTLFNESLNVARPTWTSKQASLSVNASSVEFRFYPATPANNLVVDIEDIKVFGTV